jgi:hypothetical protein
MKIFRDNINSQFEIENGLVVLQLPQTKKLVFLDGTNDSIIYRRKMSLTFDDEFLIQHNAVVGMG